MDGALRELERTLRTSATAADVHAYLRALVRSGPPDRAALLGWLADDPPATTEALARALTAHGQEVLVRGALAAARPLLETWERHVDEDLGPRAREAVDAARAWPVVAPRAPHG